MKLADWYILREWGASLGFMLAVAVGFLLLDDLYRNFGLFIEQGVGWSTVAWYFILRLPGFLPIIVPLALLLSLLFVLGQWQRNHELTALRCAGLGLWRITWIFWLIGVIFSFLLLGLSAEIIPRSVERAENLLLSLRAEGQPDLWRDQNLTLHNRETGRFWMVERYDRTSGVSEGISVQEMIPGEDGEGFLRVIYAREGHFDEDSGEWLLRHASEGLVDVRTGEMGNRQPHEELRLAAPLETPEMMLLLARRTKDLTLLQLEKVRRYLRQTNDPQITTYDVQYHSTWAGTFRALIVVAIAIPFSITGVRRNAMIGVTKSVGLFIFYFLLENLCALLGERGIFPVAVVVWIPSFIMLGIGGWFFHQAQYPD